MKSRYEVRGVLPCGLPFAIRCWATSPADALRYARSQTTTGIIHCVVSL